MALKPSNKPAEKAAPESAEKVNNDAVDTTAAKDVKVDDKGNAINEGDANGKPVENALPLTPQAIENSATAEQAANAANEEAAQQRALAEEAGKDVPKEYRQDRVQVHNLKPTSFRQPETGTWISGHGEAYLLDDGWLDNQIKAKLLAYGPKPKPKADDDKGE